MEHDKNFVRRGRERCDVGFLSREQRNKLNYFIPTGLGWPCLQSDTHRPAVRPHRLGRCVWAVVQLQVVVLATSRVIDVNLGKGDGQQPPSGCSDAPLAVGAVGVGPWIVGACKGTVVPVENATAA